MRKRSAVAYGAIGALIFFDVALKVWARALLAAGERFFISTPFGPIGLIPFVNDRLAFSLPIPNVFIWPVGWVVIVVLAYACVRASPTSRPGIAAIIVGATSNLVDRTISGGVTDYLSLSRVFPAFNIADILIIVGMGWWWRSGVRGRETATS